MTKQVIAIADGFYKGHRIRKGTKFEIADNIKIGKWMQEIAAPKAAPKVEAPKEETVEKIVDVKPAKKKNEAKKVDEELA